jgi:phage repressor protein C with HTH and peptisase S24 domain
MPAAVVSIDSKRGARQRQGFWSLLEVAQAGAKTVPYGVLFVNGETDAVTVRTRDSSAFEQLSEDEFDFLGALADDLDQKGREMGGAKLLSWLEDSASNYLRVSDRTAIAFSSEHATVNALFEEHVDGSVRPFITHLPVYSLRAAATRFGEGMDVEQEQEGWVRAPEHLKLLDGMFVAHVVGRSMEPEIPDDSACVFRAPVMGSRYGRKLLIEQFSAGDDFRYTIKRYMRHGGLREGEDREQPVRLQPLNPEFDAFELTSDQFRVIAEFVEVLPS